MALLRVLAVAVIAAAAAILPAGADADAPWSASAPVAGVASTTTLLTTQIGGKILVGASSSRSLASPTVVARVQDDGSTARRQTLEIAYAKAATFRRAGVVVAGSRPALTSEATAKAPVVVALGSVRGIHGVGTPRPLPGSGGQWVSAVAGNPASGTVAIVTASMFGGGPPTRTVWLYRGGTFHRALTFRPETNARDAAVAVGAHGDVVVAWQGRGAIFARHFGPTGRAGARHRLGAGVQSALQARIDDDGRLEVAWESQRVAEGFAATPATVSYTSAAPGGGFAPARIVGGSSLTGTGRYVMRPGVRLVGTRPNASLLAWTDYNGTRFRVRVADVTAGAVGAPQTVSAADGDAALGDVASSPAGGQLVLWLTGTHGADRSGPQRVAAAVRAPGAAAFGAPELVSEPVGAPGPAADATSVPVAPSAAADSRVGRGFAAWTTLDQHTHVAVRPVG
ncbi:MAG TPA: hypothetical protein VGO71_05680 [Baekduia sp.]|nr:hypothetical protein [Baekduia sp.]